MELNFGVTDRRVLDSRDGKENDPVSWPILRPVEETASAPHVGCTTETKRRCRTQLEALAQLARDLEGTLPEALQEQALFLVLLVEPGGQVREPGSGVEQLCVRPLTSGGYLAEREQQRARLELNELPTLENLKKQLDSMQRIPYFLDSFGRLQHYREALQNRQDPSRAFQVAFVAAMLLEAGLGQALQLCRLLLESFELHEQRIRELEHECTIANVECAYQENAWRIPEAASAVTGTTDDTASGSVLYTDSTGTEEQVLGPSRDSTKPKLMDGCRIKQLLRPGLLSEDKPLASKTLDASTDQDFITAIMQDMDCWDPGECEENRSKQAYADMEEASSHHAATTSAESGHSSSPARDEVSREHVWKILAPASFGAQLEDAVAECRAAHLMPTRSGEGSAATQTIRTEVALQTSEICRHRDATFKSTSPSANAIKQASQPLEDQVCALHLALESARRQYHELRSHLMSKILEIRQLSRTFQEYCESREHLAERDSAMRRLVAAMESHCEHQQDVIRTLQISCVEAEMRAQQADALQTANEELCGQLLCMQARLCERDERIANLENELHALQVKTCVTSSETASAADSAVTDQSSLLSMSTQIDASEKQVPQSTNDRGETSPVVPATCLTSDEQSEDDGHMAYAFETRPRIAVNVNEPSYLPILVLFQLFWIVHIACSHRAMQQRRMRCGRIKRQYAAALSHIASLRREKTDLYERLERLEWDTNATRYQRLRLERDLMQAQTELNRCKRLHQQSLWYWLRRLAPTPADERQSARCRGALSQPRDAR